MLKTLLPYLWLPGSVLLGVALALVICLLIFGSTALLPLQVIGAFTTLAAFVFLGFIGAQIYEIRSFNKEIDERYARKSPPF